MTEHRDYDCIECEDKEGGCPECNDDLRKCSECGEVFSAKDLDDNGECEDCVDNRTWNEQLASDYRHSVL
jgi:hypothetical protein